MHVEGFGNANVWRVCQQTNQFESKKQKRIRRRNERKEKKQVTKTFRPRSVR